jgi:hypothetical protein
MRAPCIFLSAALLLNGAGCATSDIRPRPTAQQIAELEGVYALSDGHQAHLFNMDDRLYVRIDARAQKELRVAGPNRFASRSGDVVIQVPADRGDDDRILVEYVRYPGGHAPSRFASGLFPGRRYAN